MNAFRKFLTIVLLFSFLAACGAPATTTPETATELTAAEQWAKDNGVGPYQPETDDWAAIEAAAIKEGKVTIYANSSKITKLAEGWAAKYPDIVFDGIETDGIDTKMAAEQEASNVVGDVWFNSDGHILYGKFVPNQWLWSFVPRDIVMPEVTAERPFAIARHSTDVIGYNNKINPNGCPVTNVWQLTEPAYKAKFFMEDPISDVSTMAKMATFVQNADDLAKAYQDLYGKEWTADELAGADASGLTPENAGYLWLKKLAYNKVVILDDGDKVDEAYAGLEVPEGQEPGLGFSGYSSYEATMDGELNMSPCFGMKPAMGIFKTSYLAIANKAQHPNAAKLFIRYVLTNEGFDPWNKVGTYPAAEGLEVNEDNLPLEELLPQVWEMDPVFDWENVSKVRDFWAASLLVAP